MLIQGSLLAQVQASASASTAFTATLRTEITRITICNTTGNDRKFRLFHDDSGSATYGVLNALRYDQTASAHRSVEIVALTPSSGYMLKRGGRLGIEADVGAALTYSIYGVTETPYPDVPAPVPGFGHNADRRT